MWNKKAVGTGKQMCDREGVKGGGNGLVYPLCVTFYLLARMAKAFIH